MVEDSGAVEAAPASAPAVVPAQNSGTPNPSHSFEPFIYKIQLYEYTQKARIPTPVYQTVNEGPPEAPKFRSTVLVDEVSYVSATTFRNRKGAEYDAARIALEYVSKKIKDDSFLLLNEDLVFCKSILAEYAEKLHLKKPKYKTKLHRSSLPVLQTTLLLDGVVYTGDACKTKKEAERLAGRTAILSLFGDVGNPKSQKTIAEIILSKVRLNEKLQKAKDLIQSQTQSKPMPENTQEHVAMTVNKDKEVKDAILVNGEVSGATSEVPPKTMTHFRPAFMSKKLEPESPPVRLPIEFVPSNLEDPIGDCARVTRNKRTMKKKAQKARKKLCVENRVATTTSKPVPPCSVAQ